MTIIIPKQLRTVEFTELTMVELNDIDIDRLMPHLWELIVKNGRLGPPPKNADDYDYYLNLLAASPRLDGFDDEQGRKVLDGWLRSSVVRIERDRPGGTGRHTDGLHPAADDRQLPRWVAKDTASAPRSYPDPRPSRRAAEAARGGGTAVQPRGAA